MSARLRLTDVLSNGRVAAALTLGARRQGVLLSLLVLPLYVPPLVFGAGAVEASAAGTAPRADLYILGALTLTALALTYRAADAFIAPHDGRSKNVE